MYALTQGKIYQNVADSLRKTINIERFSWCKKTVGVILLDY